jgi:hypothetical protein
MCAGEFGCVDLRRSVPRGSSVRWEWVHNNQSAGKIAAFASPQSSAFALSSMAVALLNTLQ